MNPSPHPLALLGVGTMVSMLLIIVLSGCEKETKAPDVHVEATLDLGGEWSVRVVVLPTGERVPLTYRYHSNGHGGQISTAAVCLPPLPQPDARAPESAP